MKKTKGKKSDSEENIGTAADAAGVVQGMV